MSEAKGRKSSRIVETETSIYEVLDSGLMIYIGKSAKASMEELRELVCPTIGKAPKGLLNMRMY